MKVSIITVCFNSVATIEQTIQSVINQTYKNIEYIIIDGGSTDGTIDIVKKYKDKIAYFVTEPDDGLYYAMNKGIDKASGEIVGIINSDDWYSIHAVEKAVACFLDEECDVVYGDLTFVSPNGSEIMSSAKNIKPMDICYKNIHWHPTIFVKRDMYSKYGLFDCRYRIYADYQFLLRLFYRKAAFAYIPFNMAYFRTDGLHSKKMWRLIREEKNIAIDGLKNIDLSYKEMMQASIENHYEKNMRAVREKFCLERICKYHSDTYVEKAIKIFFQGTEGYQIFGTGMDGAMCYDLLSKNKILVTCFFDNSFEKQGGVYDNIPILKPPISSNNKRNLKIIIATSKYEKEIGKQLEMSKFEYKKDFIYFSELKQEIVSLYIQKISRKKMI